MFADAKDIFVGVGAQADALEVDAMLAECFVCLEDGESALALSTEALTGIEALGGASIATSLLQRVRGYAFTQLGRFDEAHDAFEASIRDARERGVDHEIALTLLAAVRLARLRREEIPEGIQEEADAILGRLGIVSLPAPPTRRRGSS